ncbi:MAG: DUF2218 domain-containing protein [Planktomarina sp.]|nr:DUF2218 domain-containing protein [Planktomarina sp.]MDT2018799.1 DUF2218 domain-containing protein [Planktomarina sp.]
MASSNTIVKTKMASRYLQQLCKHFAHKIKVEFNEEKGCIQFDFGKTDLIARPEELSITVKSESDENLARLRRVVGSHLERFAFREKLVMEWSN